MIPENRRLFTGLIVAFIAAAFLLALELIFKNTAYQSLYFVPCTSETMMQTVSIEDLRDQPFRSLWYLHIQPPLYDMLRATLAQVFHCTDTFTMLRRVDIAIYGVWLVFYAATAFVIFWWLSEFSGLTFATVSALLFITGPPAIFYASFLETTFPSAFFILCLMYLLWRIKAGKPVCPVGLAIVFLALYFTRSLFQWHWLVLLLTVLVLLKFPWRKTAVFVLICGSVVGLYTIKQKTLFNLTATSSFTGFNLCQSIGAVNCRYNDYVASFPADPANANAPMVLTRLYKPDGTVNFNNANFLELNKKLTELYRRSLRAAPLPSLCDIYRGNLIIYLMPSSRYTSHAIVDRLPWRGLYDWIFSYPVLIALFACALIFWFAGASRQSLPGAFAIALPVICIAAISVFCECGENHRFKFFIEPVIFIFLASQFHSAFTAIRRR